MIVSRPELRLHEKFYLPAVLGGLVITFRNMVRTMKLLVFGRPKQNRSLMDMSVTGFTSMQYPEEKWPLPDGYRGAPVLVKDEEGREKCVSCQLCEFVCPPKAIRITPGELSKESRWANVEKGPQEFDIDMLRCIYCGMCEEVCPEEAIWLLKDHPIVVGYDRASMVHHKDKLYEMGGVLRRPIKKWAGK
jgi:NADH-quinone oxidoreductase subunit I